MRHEEILMPAQHGMYSNDGSTCFTKQSVHKVVALTSLSARWIPQTQSAVATFWLLRPLNSTGALQDATGLGISLNCSKRAALSRRACSKPEPVAIPLDHKAYETMNL